MDKIEDFQKQNDTNVVIKTAANSAMEKLKKYYKTTDALVYTVSTSIYIFYLIFFFFTIYVGLFIFTIFLVLDPRLKLTYHRGNNWEEEYIAEAQKTISDLYENQYAPVAEELVEEDNELSDDDLFCHIYKKRRLSNNENELDLYLKTPIVPAEVDLLQWWKVCIIK
jgi:hypothetical protein